MAARHGMSQCTNDIDACREKKASLLSSEVGPVGPETLSPPSVHRSARCLQLDPVLPSFKGWRNVIEDYMFGRTTVFLGDSVNRQARIIQLSRWYRSVLPTLVAPAGGCILTAAHSCLSSQIETMMICEARRLGFNVTEVGTEAAVTDETLRAVVRVRDKASRSDDIALRVVVFTIAEPGVGGEWPGLRGFASHGCVLPPRSSAQHVRSCTQAATQLSFQLRLPSIRA